MSGLLVWIPLGLTFIVLKLLIGLIDNIVPNAYKIAHIFNIDIPGIGVVLVIVIVFITGLLTNNYIGIKVLGYWNKLLNKIPIVRIVYNSIKQVSDTFLNDSNNSFKKVILVEYPRKDLWTIAFLTGNYRGEAEKIIGDDIVNIYIPTTPNPTSGFFIMLPKKDVKELKMSVDDALKLVISGGIVIPNEDKQVK